MATRSSSSKKKPPAKSAAPRRTEPASGPELFVVGVGASAGGLQALQAFFGAIKEVPNAAFVVVQHLSPDFKSFMVELLTKHTQMPVQRAEQNTAVQPGNIYLIPPKFTLRIARGRLQLEKTDPRRGLHLPIDQFFISLARDLQHRAVAVVLSGTGSDGTAGIRMVKDAGGMVMVQSEESAQFDGMPRSAIATGLADFVLPPEKMPAQLATYLSHPLLKKPRTLAGRRGQDVDGILAEIFDLMRNQCGVDFSHYKPATVDRRLERRMSVSQIETLADYARHLVQSPREVSLLFNEMLIAVTEFFRDRPAWDALEKDVLPGLLKALPPKEPVRAWVAGCCTGEEAYSLAILVTEQMEKLKMHNAVKIFATDIARDSLETAARGLYSASEVAGVSPALLEKYFTQESHGYRVRSRLREMVVFANHNLLNDPPFTKVSLICCRNLLIYLQAPMQQRVLTLFSFALREEGALFLGSSESIGDATDRFHPLSTRANLFRNRRRGIAPPGFVNPPRVKRTAIDPSAALQRAASRITVGEVPAIEEVHSQIIAQFSPACLVVDSRDEVVHIVGNAGEYLKMVDGSFSRNLFKLTSHNLANALRSALIRAQQKGDKFTYENVRYTEGRKTHAVHIHVRPVPDKRGQPSGTRLIFIERAPTPPKAGTGKRYRPDVQSAHRITDLERDLSLTRDTLQATVQDLETSNEEIQAANEELLASNEELQSTNEELQSVNEELHTVNTENQNRIDELTRLTNDINNLLATASIGVLLLDGQLRVRRASRSALVTLDLTEADVGVPIETVARILHVPDLPQSAARVIKSGQLEELEIEHNGSSRRLLVRCAPFRDELARARGVVITLLDITERYQSEQRTHAQADVMQGVLDALDAHVAIMDREGRIVHVNKGWREFAATNPAGGLAPSVDVGANYFESCAAAAPRRDPDAAAALEGMHKVLNGALTNFSHDYVWEARTEKRWFRLHAVAVQSPEPGLAVAHFNITPLKMPDRKLSETPPRASLTAKAPQAPAR